jgi:hypothetical protein
MTERQNLILRALRTGPLDLMTLSDQIEEPPFAVRAELRAMRREWVVRNRLTPNRALWHLTPYGERVAWELDQLELRPHSQRS